MNDRLITAAGALCAVLIFIALVYAPAQTLPVSRPTSLEQGPNGYLGLQRWLEETGVKNVSLRRRWQSLQTETRIKPAGNVMVTTAPYSLPLRDRERTALHDWIAAGNTLLILAALDDTPEWVYASNSSDFLENLEDITGLWFEVQVDEEDETLFIGDSFEPVAQTYTPVFDHPLLEGVEELQGVSDSVSSLWYPVLWESPDFVLRLTTIDEYDTEAMWLLPRGDGQIILSASASLLSNRMLGESSNAQFFANILAWHLRPGGTVIFDDFHQGLSDLYDPEAFFGDERLHNSVWFIFLFWFLYLVGSSNRLVPVRKATAQSSQVDLVRAMGGFMARKLSEAEAGRVMVQNWLQELRRSGHIVTNTTHPPWNHLETMPLIDTAVLAEVRDSYSRLGRGEKVDLKGLHNKLLILKRNLA